MTRVAFQGEPGAYGEDAVARFFGVQATAVPCRAFKEVFERTEKGSVNFGVVPVENSWAGSINDTYDLLRYHRVKVYGEINLRIRHCLLALPGQTMSDIKQVYSHPQALAQCADFIEKHQLEAVPVYDTAGGARMIKEKEAKRSAAIASQRASELYGLAILASDIQTVDHNYTKFYVIATKPAPYSPNSKTTMIMAVPNSPGALYRCLGVLAERNINLTKLESRPRRDKPWEYLFYVDCEGHVQDPALREAVAELKKATTYLKILGSFPKAED